MDIPIDQNIEQLIETLEVLESGGNVNAIGDLGKAFGVLQIHQGCLDDVNRVNGTNYVVKEMLGETGAKLSRWVFREYMKIYANEKRLGRPVTNEDRARIWNGGPNGWKKSVTRGYAASMTKVFAEKFNDIKLS
jgi:hypothetical protein